MRKFFHGWKRKTGCSTLVMALVFMGGWVKSIGRLETIHACPGRSLFVVASRDQNLCVSRSTYQSHDVAISKSITLFYSSLKELNVGCSSEKSSSESNTEYWTGANSSFRNANPKWCWKLGGFILTFESHTTLGDEHETMFATVPYWSITIPLTFISLWLLLIRPRQSTPLKIVEPTANDGSTS